MATRTGQVPRLFVAVVGLALALACYEPFALAAGVPATVTDVYGHAEPGAVLGRVVCGLVIFALVITGAGPLVRQVRGLIGGMRGAASKPGQRVAMTLIVCGTACILGAIAVEFYLVRHGQTVLAAWGAGHAMTGSERVVIGVEPPVFGHLMTVLTFVAGGTLAGIGVWASTGKVTAYPAVPPVPSAA